jgi:hypothetical protein
MEEVANTTDVSLLYTPLVGGTTIRQWRRQVGDQVGHGPPWILKKNIYYSTQCSLATVCHAVFFFSYGPPWCYTVAPPLPSREESFF